MSDKTNISWTEATWNPLRGCSKVSDGCRNCYAEGMAARFSGPGLPYEGTITDGRWNGQIRLVPEVLQQPLRWQRPRRIFVNSMSDLFHKEVPQDYIDKVFAVMALAPRHTFQILTKRPDRMKNYLQGLEKRGTAATLGYAAELVTGDEIAHHYVNNRILAGATDKPGWPLKNVWLGVSVENQMAADERIPLLLQTPAAVRFLSCEPLLGPVDLFQAGALTGGLVNENEFDAHGNIDWVIAGGESGHGARPMHPDWVRSLRDQCQAAGVAFHFKQWGAWAPYVDDDKFTHCGAETARNMQHYVNPDGSTGECWLVDGDGTWQNWTGEPNETCAVVNRVGKAAAGRMLDGRTWEEFPEGK